MTRFATRRIFRLTCAAGFIAALQACGGGGGTPGGSSGLPVLTSRAIPITVTLPPGVAAAVTTMSAETSLGASKIPAGGATQVKIFNDGPMLVKVYDAARNVALMGWVGAGRTVVNVHTTAEVLLYFDLHGYLLPGDGRMKVVDGLTTRTEVQPVATAISTALAADPKALNGTNAAIKAARLTAQQQILASGRSAFVRGHAAAKSRGVIVDPLEPKSGVTVNVQGLNSIVLHNDYRRRAIAFVERVSFQPEGGGNEVLSPAELPEVELEPTVGVSSITETLADVVNGNMAYVGVDSQPIQLPVDPSTAVTTKYKVIVCGLGRTSGDFAELSEEQKSKVRLLCLKSFIVDFAVPLVANTIMPLKGEAVDDFLGMTNVSVLVEDLVKTLGSTAPKILEEIEKGEISNALAEMYNTLTTSKSFRLLFLETVRQIFVAHWEIGNQLAFQEAGQRFMEAVNITEAVLSGIDGLVQIVQIGSSQLASSWEVTANKSKVRLNPEKGDIGKNEIQTFTAVIPTATGDNPPVLTYHWSTTAAHGKIRDANHSPSTAFDSSSASVVYEADRTTTGKDTITVTAFEVKGPERNSIGTATAEITTRSQLPTIVPDRASLKKGETQSFKAKLDASANDGGVLSYRWFSTDKFGNVTGVTENVETGSATASYVSTSSSEGEDTMAVEVFSSKNGQKNSLGIARAQVKTQLKKTIVFGSYSTEPSPVPNNPDLTAVTATVHIPKVAGAKGYSIRCYDFYDRDYYGHEAHFGPYTETPTGAIDKGGEFWLGISGTGGAHNQDLAATIAYYDSRFKGMTVEVTVTY